LELMTRIDPSNGDVYRRLIEANRGEPGLLGHKHYWRSDISVHRRPTWYASVKMSSTRVIGAETCNSENMLGLHLGDGVTYFCRTGREYEDIFPVWDWRRLPGTTCQQGDSSLVPAPKRCRGRSDFVGGVSDGRRGLAAMEYIRHGLRARKAWFFLDDAVVCTAADIDSNRPGLVVTSVNQCLLNGPVTVSAGREVSTLTNGIHKADDIEWVHHNGIGYAFLEPATTAVRAAEQQGNWHRIHHRESKRNVERNVFSLWINHGSKPNGAAYGYAVFPDVAAEAMRTLHRSRPFKIIQQTASLQAISTDEGGYIQAAFFDPGRLAVDENLAIEVDAPCLVIIERTPASIRLYVADPTHLCETIGIRLSGRYAGPTATYDPAHGRTKLTVELPQEGRAGQTASVTLKPKTR
jgi:chondroitin AC lyase